METENKKIEVATFAEGCFWGVEEEFRHLKGVRETIVGYTGGHSADPSYDDVCSGKTGHAEAVEIKFDPAEISYQDLLKIFWKTHDPSQYNRQGPDIGTQYRSAIFYHNEGQRKLALESKDKVENSDTLLGAITTEIAPAGKFWRAEEYHQQYFEKTGRATCRTP